MDEKISKVVAEGAKPLQLETEHIASAAAKAAAAAVCSVLLNKLKHGVKFTEAQMDSIMGESLNFIKFTSCTNNILNIISRPEGHIIFNSNVRIELTVGSISGESVELTLKKNFRIVSDGLLFTALGKFYYGIWKHNKKYYVFDGQSGTSRLNVCTNLKKLVDLLVKSDNEKVVTTFTLHKVMFHEIPNPEPREFFMENCAVELSHTSWRLVTSGNIAQDSRQFSEYSRNNQCMANALCSLLLFKLNGGTIFTSEEIDTILNEGDNLYRMCRLKMRNDYVHLSLEDLPKVDEIVVVFGRSMRLDVSYLFEEYQDDTTVLDPRQRIARSLTANFADANDLAGSIFTCNAKTIAFWRWNEKYYIFDSHSVSSERAYVQNGLARLFECDSLDSLTSLLITGNLDEYGLISPYEIGKVRIEVVMSPDSPPPQIPVREIVGKDTFSLKEKNISRHSYSSPPSTPPRPKRPSTGDITTRNVNLLPNLLEEVVSDSEEDEEVTPNKGGRPRKRGRKGTGVDRASIVKKYHTENADKLKKARELYAREHPDKVKEARELFAREHPDKVKEARELYAREHPDKVKEAQELYAREHPDKFKEARELYAREHPDKVKEARELYARENPDNVRASQQLYCDTHKAEISENQNTRRSIPKDVHGLLGSLGQSVIGSISGNALEKIEPLTLAKPSSLLSGDTFKCPHCGASKFEEEKKQIQMCCGQGKNLVNRLPEIEAGFYRTNVFLKNARTYNNLFAFSASGSVGAETGTGKKNRQIPKSGGPCVVKIHGRVYHRIMNLNYNGKHDPKLGQSSSSFVNNTRLYVIDNNARDELAVKRNVSVGIVNEIRQYLTDVNPLVSQLKFLSELAEDSAHIYFEETSRVTHGPILGDRPVSNEIAGIICTDVGCSHRAVCIYKKHDDVGYKNVSIFAKSYECLQFPLLFPHASTGWHIGLKNNEGKQLSQLAYYRVKLFSEERFTLTRRLGQEYFVDMYCRNEESNLNFIKKNQENVTRCARTAPRNELESDETIAGEGGVAKGRIYLPSSYTHSPRYMQLKYHDAMAVVSRLGKPTYFVTLTCNPNWPEIKNSLRPGESANDRPDLCNRVFYSKLKKILKMIMRPAGKKNNKGKSLFGPAEYITHVIEFQKRGLPHAHVCFRIKGGGPVQSEDIDIFVRATIPSEEESSRLRTAVLTHMIHGPCGFENRNAPCNDASFKCTKLFPKPANQVTHSERGFVIYKRPCLEDVSVDWRRGKRTINDGYVVPYNPALLLMWNGHVNVEVASSAKTLKYMMKYIHKGPDHAKAAIVVENNDPTTKNLKVPIVDEIDSYVKMRYVSASEALWRILEYPNIGRNPTVYPLPVHLPQKDIIVFRPGEERAALERTISKLNLYLERPQVPEVENLTYVQFYEGFSVERRKSVPKKVTAFPHSGGAHFYFPRQRTKPVCRMYWMSPSLGEVYYLRMLLNVVPAYSFESLRTVGGTVYNTFQEAAFALGLLDTEDEYTQAMREAVTFNMPKTLRQLFFALIMVGAPAKLLWDQFADHLCEDFTRIGDSIETARRKALLDIGRMLCKHGRGLIDMGLEEVQDDESSEVTREQSEWDTEAQTSFVLEWLDRLNVEQKLFYSTIIETVENPEGKNKVFFLDGFAGTGKTVLLNVITAKLRSTGRIVLCTSSTGISALNYPGGTTAHSMFKIPIEIGEFVRCNMSAGSERAELIRNSSLIIWDESPMSHQETISTFDRSMQDICSNDAELFGGKIIIFSGDFRQIPPVIRYGTSKNICQASIRLSTFWARMSIHKLTIAQRTKGDADFSEFVLSVGSGQIPQISMGNEKVIPLNGIPYVKTREDLVEFVFPDSILEKPEQCLSRAILATTNANIDEINELIMSKIKGDAMELYSADKLLSVEGVTNTDVFGPEMLNSVTEYGIPDHILRLKVGTICIVVRNLSFNHKLVNGAKVIIRAIQTRIITAELADCNEKVFIPRVLFKFKVGSSGFEMTRKQFPLKLAYGLTINKSQGQTLNRVGVDLRSSVFCHGQLYVALGRVRKSSDIRVLVGPDNIKNGTAYTQNVIFPDLLT